MKIRIFDIDNSEHNKYRMEIRKENWNYYNIIFLRKFHIEFRLVKILYATTYRKTNS